MAAMAKLAAWLLVSMSVGGCATSAEPTVSDRTAPRAPARRADVEARTATPPVAPPRPTTSRVVARAAAADAPLTIDLDAAAFPARALDPVLLVGDARLTRYRYLPGGVLRFFDDAGAVRAGVPVALQYGREVASRRELSAALVLEVTP